MFSKKNTKKGFTLIEMLIVIVIIGILAAALIPRLSSARGRANDVARKADLAQVAAALVSYQIDHGSFPPTAGSLNTLSDLLISAGMNSIPSDPNSSRVITSINGTGGSGQYYYSPISKGGIANNGFILVAGTETVGGSNWNSSTQLLGTSYDTYEKIQSGMCNQSCTAVTGDYLKYLYLY